MKKELLLPLLLLLFHAHFSFSLNKEGLILLQAKGRLVDPNRSLADWNSFDPTPCNWTGISCSHSATITAVELGFLDLSGPFPADLCRLPSLSVIDLNHNQFTGPLPSSLAFLPLIDRLDLAYNNFSGPIPESFALFPRLKDLFLLGNNLESPVPEFLANVTSLRGLDLSFNFFSHAKMPASFGNLSSIVSLRLQGCSLVGSIPASLSRLSALEELDLSSNSLTGAIPNSFANLTALDTLDLSDNNLDGGIPTGIFLVPGIQSLILYNNQLSGPIPSTLSRSFKLKELNVMGNRLSGSLPAHLGKNSPLTFLELSDNLLTGEIPASLCDGGALELLCLRNNSFSGRLPKSLGRCQKLNRIRLESNRLSGEVPAVLWGLPHVHLLDLSSNNFSGEISRSISSAANLSTLLISDNQFTGTIPEEVGVLWNLNKLRAANNQLKGQLPASLGRLANLVQLDLHNNSLFGELPRGIESWGKLSLLDLSGNEFSGAIPSELGDLPVLNYLDLSCNELTGQIPPQLQNLNLNHLSLSHNHLSGPLPPLFATHSYCYSFAGNPGLNLKDLCISSKDRTPKRHVLDWVLRSLCLVSILALVTGSALFYWKHRSSHKTRDGLYKLKWTVTSFHKLRFGWYEILDCLDEGNVIGSGASGKVYKAVLGNGEMVAVKKLWGKAIDGDRIIDDGFGAEVEALGKIRHKNIVRLWCSYTHQDCKLLVYEYMPNGSLWDLLHLSNGLTLDWPMRYKIALDVAEGLSYLHHDCEPPIVHRDVKSSNILIDEGFRARVADFGIARTVGKDTNSVTTVMGAIGYIAPEYAYTFRVNEKSDVYSFGIVILELVTGRLPVDPELGDKDFVSWVCNTMEKEGIGRVGDPSLDTCFSEEICDALDIGLLCTSYNPTDRPTMQGVVKMLLEMSWEAKQKSKRCTNNSKTERTLHTR